MRCIPYLLCMFMFCLRNTYVHNASTTTSHTAHANAQSDRFSYAHGEGIPSSTHHLIQFVLVFTYTRFSWIFTRRQRERTIRILDFSIIRCWTWRRSLLCTGATVSDVLRGFARNRSKPLCLCAQAPRINFASQQR